MFLTLHLFNDRIVEGHKILSDRVIKFVSKALDWNMLIISLEKEGMNLLHEIPYREIVPRYRDWFIHTIKIFTILKSFSVNVIHILAYNKLFLTLLNKIISIGKEPLRVIIHLYFHPRLFNDPRYFPIKLLLKQRIVGTVLVTSEILKKHLVKDMLLPNEHVHVIYPIVPYSFFEFDYMVSRELTPQIRKEYGLDESDFVLTYIGHVIPQRGIFELLKAFKKATACNSSLKLVIAHSGIVFKDLPVDYLTLLKRIIMKYELEKKIILIGKQDLKNLYTLSDILFFGFKDSFLFTFPPLVVCEAMAAGMPFILRRSSSLVEELFGDSTPVPLYSCIDELANVICELPDRRGALFNISEKVKNIAITKFYPSNILSRLFRIYYEVGGKK